MSLFGKKDKEESQNKRDAEEIVDMTVGKDKKNFEDFEKQDKNRKPGELPKIPDTPPHSGSGYQPKKK